MKVVMFSKNIDTLPIAEAAEAMKKAGFDGVDVPVRRASGTLPPGRVLPENVRTELPSVVRKYAEFGLQVPMVSAGIQTVQDPHAVDIFEAAAASGINTLRLALWPYPGFGSFGGELERIDAALDQVEKLGERTGVRAVIHVHSGNFMSANPLAVWYWIKDRNPAAIGAYVDLEHITKETGSASRTMAIDLLGRRTNVIAAKDFAWRVEGSPALATELTLRRVPLGQGVVPWAEVFRMVRQAGADPIVSVHSEYLSADSWRVLSLPELIRQTVDDVKYLRSVMGG
jgi:sugar phosphate isomerase/epimerase